MPSRSVSRGGRSARDPASPAEKRKRDPLLSAISHDLRAPLAAVTMGANFILQTTRRDDAHARSIRVLEAMLRSCAQMERLIRNFTDLSEIEADAVALRLGLHDAGEILELAATAAREAASARSVTLDLRKPAPAVTIHADRDRLLRAIGHLVANAVAHAPEGSTVTLAVTSQDDTVAFSVKDRGPGISEELKPHLFDRNWHTQQANRAGTGFGLAIVRGFAEAHGGRVLVESRPGEETALTIVVPRDARPGEP
jgi:signal transduction histidine kinase